MSLEMIVIVLLLGIILGLVIGISLSRPNILS